MRMFIKVRSGDAQGAGRQFTLYLNSMSVHPLKFRTPRRLSRMVMIRSEHARQVRECQYVGCLAPEVKVEAVAVLLPKGKATFTEV